MRKARYALGVMIVMAASLFLLPAAQAAAESVPDSPQVLELLTQAKTYAARLVDDADEMHNYSLSTMSWQSHAEQIVTIKEHVNNLGKTLQELSDARESASPWQQEAIDRITPLAKELANNIESTIEHISQNQTRLHLPEYKDYLKANYELSSQLSKLISDYVEYGKSKAKYEKLVSSL